MLTHTLKNHLIIYGIFASSLLWKDYFSILALTCGTCWCSWVSHEISKCETATLDVVYITFKVLYCFYNYAHPAAEWSELNYKADIYFYTDTACCQFWWISLVRQFVVFSKNLFHSTKVKVCYLMDASTHLTPIHCSSPGVSSLSVLFTLVSLHPEESASCSSCWRGVAGVQGWVQRSCETMGSSWEKVWAERCSTTQAETAVQTALRSVLFFTL